MDMLDNNQRNYVLAPTGLVRT
ncbi:uncharacterized protein FFM5_15298 [Fusarium fujikuroi]|nr:uncharacterized protein FFM5_15298 [Fusarium fujikuroi]